MYMYTREQEIERQGKKILQTREGGKGRRKEKEEESEWKKEEKVPHKYILNPITLHHISLKMCKPCIWWDGLSRSTAKCLFAHLIP